MTSKIITKICNGPLCSGKELSLDSFSSRLNRCKKCQADTYKNKYYKKRLKELNNFRTSLKEAGSCEKCAEKNPLLLEFAHFKRSDKTVQLCDTSSVKNFQNELPKGRLLCIWCHRIETQAETLKHELKTLDDYLYKDSECILEISEQTRICEGDICKGTKRKITSFYSKGRHKCCKKCLCYSTSLKRIKAREYVRSIKINIGECLNCNRKVTKDNTCCFDFDHINRDLKTKTIADYVSNGSKLEKIDEEIKLCQLLCCNCHRIKSLSEPNKITLKINEN